MEMEMEMASETGASIAELIQALDQATLMAKQLTTTSDSSQLLQIYSSLHSAHHHLSLFLSYHHHHHPPPRQPHLLPIPPPPPVPENSVSSAVGSGDENDTDEPMQVGDEEVDDVNETEQNSVDRVEERMRGCFIQNKRPKRPLSPVSAAAVAAEQQRRSYDNDGGPPALEFDPHGTRLRSLDLIYQFHS
ncbi:uncharacterized protein LOC107796844 [Nicotiana tabacum]|uniref:Uncharacterized protein LOC107796844 n=1 Tax=Nicotiana tabacum TaxID=4097 RepID=A0A1S4AEU0_TOBAC|nr:PREDICTED: uncharacterized protein LOC107796844 [Nicotiana tabacum]